MASIDFRGWRIESDAEGWALGRPKLRVGKYKEREIYLSQPTYYSKLDAALAGLLEREVRASDATTAQEIIALIRQIRMELKEALAS